VAMADEHGSMDGALRYDPGVRLGSITDLPRCRGVNSYFFALPTS